MHSKPSFQRPFSLVQDFRRKPEIFFLIELYRFSQVEALLTFIMRQILNCLVPDIAKKNFLFVRP